MTALSRAVVVGGGYIVLMLGFVALLIWFGRDSR